MLVTSEIVYIIGSSHKYPKYNYFSTVFYQYELPILTRPGSGVTKITAIDALNQANRKVIWTPGRGHWGMGGKDEASTPSEIFEPPKGLSCRLKRAGDDADCVKPQVKSKTPPTAAKVATPNSAPKSTKQKNARRMIAKSCKISNKTVY